MTQPFRFWFIALLNLCLYFIEGYLDLLFVILQGCNEMSLPKGNNFYKQIRQDVTAKNISHLTHIMAFS